MFHNFKLHLNILLSFFYSDMLLYAYINLFLCVFSIVGYLKNLVKLLFIQYISIP